MKQPLLFLFCFLFKATFAQYKIDSRVKDEYMTTFGKLSDKIKDDSNTEFKNGLGILTTLETDTLNKNEFKPTVVLSEVYIVDTATGGKEPIKTSPNEEDLISADNPGWLSCGCRFNNDTLQIASGIYLFSGFSVIINFNKDKATAFYSEYESQDAFFKTKLSDKKAGAITIPATINDLVINQAPQKQNNEIFGKVSVTTSGYYSYVNAWGFKHGYIYKRTKIQFYFRCDTKDSAQK